MGREIRRVPADWEHPKDPTTSHFKALHDGADFARRLSDWETGAAKWAEGLRDDWNGGWKPREPDETMTWAEWYGERPDPADYMPQWADSERTHLMMYETCSEGTPISPAFATPEEGGCPLVRRQRCQRLRIRDGELRGLAVRSARWLGSQRHLHARDRNGQRRFGKPGRLTLSHKSPSR